jgi:hypothetical protein
MPKKEVVARRFCGSALFDKEMPQFMVAPSKSVRILKEHQIYSRFLTFKIEFAQHSFLKPDSEPMPYKET